jgi:outer membrane receptor protein involved in Fe transport
MNFFFAIIYLLLGFTSYSQKPGSPSDGVIFGKIIDTKTNQAIEYVAVRLLNVKDSSVVSGLFTDMDGKFNFQNVAYKKYLIKISSAGFLSKIISDVSVSGSAKIYNVGTIKLEVDKALQLDEVKVVGQMDVLKSGIDKKVYNVAEDISVRGGTANDILSRLPSVEVDQDGRVMLRGEGTVTILIDGRPSSLSGGNGKTLLDALPAGSIERIEIVTNPSAKYDPDGTSGIINIVLKKNKLKGFNGAISTNLGSGNLSGGNVAEGNASISYRNSWFNVYGTYNARYLAGYRNNTSFIKQNFTDGSQIIVDQNRTGTDFNAGQTFRLGADFNLKARNTIGFSGTGNVGVRDRTGDLWNNILDETQTQTQLWQRTSLDPSQQNNFDFNLNYKWDLKDERGNLIFDVNQSLGNEKIQGFYQNNYFNPSDSSAGVQSFEKQQLSNVEKNNITSAQLDFTYLMPKINARIETGAKVILRNQQVNTYSETLDNTTNTYYQDTLANFNYKYDEQILGVYGIWGQQLGKFKYQAGLRAEQAYQIPNLLSDSIRIVNDYFKVFPSAHIRYAFTPKSEVSISYSKRITRAASSDLNPFTSYSDPFNLRRGNPYLNPEFIDSYDLAYSFESKKFNLSASSYFRRNTGVITRFKEFYDNNTSAVTFRNISETNSLGNELVLVYKPTASWRNTLSWNGNYIWYITNMVDLPNRQGFNMNMKFNTSYEFWKKTATVMLSVTYNGPRVTVQGIAQRQGPIDIAFEKKFKEGKWSVGARVSDVFNKQGFFMEIDRESVYQTSEFKWLTRRVYVSASYKFGKLEINNKSRSLGGEGGGDM